MTRKRKESRKEDRMFSGPAPEPFVNETMAQLYLQQGYRQLALRVYYQLAEARPGDQALKDRIAQIEAEDRAAHPEAAAAPLRAEPAQPVHKESAQPVHRESPQPVHEEAPQPVHKESPQPVHKESAAPAPKEPAPPPVESRREPAPVEAPPRAPAAPRAPAIEAPAPERDEESEETPRFDRTPVDSPPPPPPPSRPSAPSRQRESIEAPIREEPRAEPESIAARQPSIREFFATLGRRRPPRAAPQTTGGHSAAGYGGTQTSTHGAASAPPAAAPRPTNTAAPTNAPQPSVPMGGAPTSASLDAVFAGATVNPADSRAASRLAGAFSGTVGTSRTSPPTPPMPTPRVNPRLPAAQESEEDVAKFRAWLDGLTGE